MAADGTECRRTLTDCAEQASAENPTGHDVTAVEPSAAMRAQRPVGAAPCVAATAESLPFEDQSFDAAMAFASACSRAPEPTIKTRLLMGAQVSSYAIWRHGKRETSLP